MKELRYPPSGASWPVLGWPFYSTGDHDECRVCSLRKKSIKITENVSCFLSDSRQCCYCMFDLIKLAHWLRLPKFVQLATPVTVCAVRTSLTWNEKQTLFRKFSASILQYGGSGFRSLIWYSFVFLGAARSRSLHVAPRSTGDSRQKWIAITCRVPRKHVHHFIMLRGRQQIKTVSEIRQGQKYTVLSVLVAET
jgi:hypothetical protein